MRYEVLKIKQIYSPNFEERKGLKADMICCHQTNCSMEECIDTFCDEVSNLSAHFVVDKNGEIYNFVPIDKSAKANKTSYKSSLSQDFFCRSLNSIVAGRKQDANLYTVSVSFENDRSGVLTATQYFSGLILFEYIIREIKQIYNVDFILDRKHFVGHYELTPALTPNCPGIDFPFNLFLKDLKQRNNS